MHHVDGSMMEGGGQLLRMATAYSAILGEPVEVTNIRAKRSNPGLRPQHLTTLKALAEICGASTKGLELGSQEIELHPRSIRGGTYQIDIGTAGSISLLLQCLIPVTAYADTTVTLNIRGGTAVRWSPPIPFLEHVVWRAYQKMGINIIVNVNRHGFYPKGGGDVEVRITPVEALKPLIAVEYEQVQDVKGISLCGKLPLHVAERQAKSASYVLRKAGFHPHISVRKLEVEPFSPGSMICIWLNSSRCFIGADALGERGKPAEKVGREASELLVKQLQTGACTDLHTADHLILPVSLVEGKSVYTTSELTLHTLTAIELAKTFTDCSFVVDGEMGQHAKITCEGIGLTKPC